MTGEAAIVRRLRGRMIELQGERVAILPQRALWWPAQSTVVVADVHLGKCEAFRALGVPMPDGVLTETLRRLAFVMETCGARRLVVLGDLIHAPAGLTPMVRAEVAKILQSLGAEVSLVAGNHDRKADRLPHEWPLAVSEGPLEQAPFVMVHQPAPQRHRYVLAGHLHPTLALSAGVDSLRLPCFHFGPRIGVLPAFSAFTRGVPMSAAAGDRAFVIADGEVIEAS